MPVGYRQCVVCGKTKAIAQFALKGLGQRDRTCKECRRWQAAERRSKEYAKSLAPLLTRGIEDGRAIPAGASPPR